MTEKKGEYRTILKSTSIFGGVQVFNILISIIRSKFIAVLLGPAGMGIAALLNSTTGLIGELTHFGLGTSAVKDVAAANASGNKERISVVVTVFRRLVWVTGLLGAFIVLVFSPWLSRLTFGNGNYTIAFIWLSMTLLFSQLSSGQSVIMQGMRKLQYLARANMVGAVTGLLISVPIYYFWHIDGIVPAIILTSVAGLSITWFFSRKIPVKEARVSLKETVAEGKGMLQMGFMISLSGLMAMGASYVVRVFISRQGGVADVGLYSAGFSIISTYVGLVFTAMGTDYFPRLSGVAGNNQQANQMINQQAEISLLILGPILSVFLIFIHWIVILLYSTKFVAVNGMIHYAALGIYFKAASWAIAFVFLAKGASTLFFWSELASTVYLIAFNLLGYYFFGLDGLGIAFLLSFVVYLIQVFIIAGVKYQFLFTREFYRIFLQQMAIGISCFLTIRLIPLPYAYLAGIFLIGISSWLSFRELDKRIGVREIVNYFKERFIKKNTEDDKA